MCSSSLPSLPPAICERTHELLNPHVATACFDFELTFLLYQSQDDSKICFGATLGRETHHVRKITRRLLGGHLPLITVAQHSTIQYQVLTYLWMTMRLGIMIGFSSCPEQKSQAFLWIFATFTGFVPPEPGLLSGLLRLKSCHCSDPDASAITIAPGDHKYTATRSYICKRYQAGCHYASALYITHVGSTETYFNSESILGYPRSMVGNPSKHPFLFPFVVGLLAIVVLSASTLALVLAWRYFRRRDRRQSSIAVFAMPTIVEEGRSTSDALEFSCRGPSRLGGISPMLAERADEETGPGLKLTVRGGMDDRSLADVKPLDSNALQNSTHSTTVSTAERVDQVEDHARRSNKDPVTFDLGNSGDMVVDLGQSQSFAFPTPPKGPPFPPPAPRTPGGRLSMSTVWSQESMWPRERKIDFQVPMPPLAYLPVPQRMRPSPLVVLGPPSPRSMSSFPRSVVPSEFGDDY